MQCPNCGVELHLPSEAGQPTSYREDYDLLGNVPEEVADNGRNRLLKAAASALLKIAGSKETALAAIQKMG